MVRIFFWILLGARLVVNNFPVVNNLLITLLITFIYTNPVDIVKMHTTFPFGMHDTDGRAALLGWPAYEGRITSLHFPGKSPVLSWSLVKSYLYPCKTTKKILLFCSM